MERVDGSREALEVAGRLVVATFELRLGDRVAEAIQGGAERLLEDLQHLRHPLSGRGRAESDEANWTKIQSDTIVIYSV